jgi:adenylate kinase family enzyme
MDQQLGALAEVIEHYRSAGVLHTVDGLQEIDQVAEAIDRALAEADIRPAGSPAEPVAG